MGHDKVKWDLKVALALAFALSASPLLAQEASPASVEPIIAPADAGAVIAPAVPAATIPAPGMDASSKGPEAVAGREQRPPQEGVTAEFPADENLPHVLSPWGMFMGADFVVKGVMIGLLLASIATWRPAAVSIRCNRELTRSLSPLLAAKINNGFSALHLLLCCQNQRGADPGLARQRPDGLMKAGRRL